MNIAALWDWAVDELKTVGVDSPRFTAELLLREVMGWSRAQLLTRGAHIVPDECEERYRGFIRRRSLGVATQYIIGRQEFYGRDFLVTPAVLIPRPETEILVELTISALRDRVENMPILDLGTGSGCVGLTLAAELPQAEVTLSDVSQAALDVARENAQRLGLMDRVLFSQGDLFGAVEGRRFVAIVSNPPYIPETDRASLSAEVLGEPEGALFAGEDGLAVYRRIAAQASAYLSPGGLLLLEIGHGQGAAVSDLLAQGGFPRVELFRDLAGKERVLRALLA
jgi:release factor glutamine methyltransferase